MAFPDVRKAFGFEPPKKTYPKGFRLTIHTGDPLSPTYDVPLVMSQNGDGRIRLTPDLPVAELTGERGRAMRRQLIPDCLPSDHPCNGAINIIPDIDDKGQLALYFNETIEGQGRYVSAPLYWNMDADERKNRLVRICNALSSGQTVSDEDRAFAAWAIATGTQG